MIAVVTRCSAIAAGRSGASLWEGRAVAAAAAGNRGACNLFKVVRGGWRRPSSQVSLAPPAPHFCSQGLSSGVCSRPGRVVGGRGRGVDVRAGKVEAGVGIRKRRSRGVHCAPIQPPTGGGGNLERAACQGASWELQGGGG